MEVFCPFLMSYPFSLAVNTFSLTNCTVWHEYYGYNKQNNLYASNLFRCAILESAVQDKWFILSSTTNTSFDEKQEISNQNTIIYAGPSKLTIIHKQ